MVSLKEKKLKRESMLESAKIIQNDGLLDIEALERYIVEKLGGNVGSDYAEVKANITFTEGVISNKPEISESAQGKPSSPQTGDPSDSVIGIGFSVLVLTFLMMRKITASRNR